MATAEFSKFASILSAALSQHHLLGFEKAQLEFHHMSVANFYVAVQSLSHVSLCNLMDCSTTGSSILHCLLKFAQTHVHQVVNAIQPSHPLSSPSPSTFNLSQHQSLFQGVVSSHQVVKVLELQLQHHSFQ